MTNKEARKFLLKSESFFNAKLPDYINFDESLKSASKVFTTKKGGVNDLINIVESNSYRDRDNLNYHLIMNKDNNYSWRPLTLLHPILYVDLVNYLTKKDNWKKLQNRFSEFRKDERIKSFSIPIEAPEDSKITDTGETILNWWENIEQVSLTKNIDYKYCIYTDIADCYPSIYTHSITWAVHGKEVVKNDENYCKGSFGDEIDKKISGMQNNQTNGIPQGSVLMDFVAEIVLGYADLRLSEEIDKLNGLEEFQIIRYRDDYRIFSNNRDDLECIMKILSEVLLDLNFKLNSNKTKFSENIIIDSIKKDKLYWEGIRASFRTSNSWLLGDRKVHYSINLQKNLLEIKKLSDEYSNCGQLRKALSEFSKERISEISKKPKDLLPMIGILVDIMFNNPIVLPQCIITIGQLLAFEEATDSLKIIRAILKKYKSKPNTDYLMIWLDRLTLIFGEIVFEESLSAFLEKIKNPVSNQLFSTDWLRTEYRNKFYEGTITDENKQKKMSSEIFESELSDFYDYPF